MALQVLVAACGGGADAAGGPGGHGGPPPASVSVEKVAPANIPASYEYVGETAGWRDVEVRARVAGIMLTRNFKEGSAVKKGQSLYTLDPAPFQLALNRADADLASAEARLAQATRTMGRLKPQWEAKAISQREYDDAVSAEEVARADMKGAQARRSEAALNLGYSRVESPIGGVAGRSLPSEGTLVSGPDVLLTTVTQTDPVKVRFGIADTDQMNWRNESAAGRLVLPANNAFEVEVKLADGSTYSHKGKLLFSDTRVSGSTGTIQAEAEVPNPDGALRPGQFVRVRLLGAVRPKAVRIPSRAVLEGPQGKFVYLAADGKALPRPVTVGDQLADGWIVTSGLSAGDSVIVDGMARIFFPGAPIVIAPPAAASGPAGGKTGVARDAGARQ